MPEDITLVGRKLTADVLHHFSQVFISIFLDIRIKVSNPTEFFKQKKKREDDEKNGNAVGGSKK